MCVWVWVWVWVCVGGWVWVWVCVCMCVCFRFVAILKSFEVFIWRFLSSNFIRKSVRRSCARLISRIQIHGTDFESINVYFKSFNYYFGEVCRNPPSVPSYSMISNIPFVIYYVMYYISPFVNLLLIQKRTWLVVWTDTPEHMVAYIVRKWEGWWDGEILKQNDFFFFKKKKIIHKLNIFN